MRAGQTPDRGTREDPMVRILVAVDETPDGLEPVRLAAGLALGPATRS